MANDNSNIKIYIGALIMIILQLFVGPIISINAIVPNLLLAYTVVCVVSRPDKLHLGFAFVMGLLFDLVCNGPVGAMAFVMLITSFIMFKILNKLKKVNLGISLLVIFASILFCELFYGVFQISLSLNTGLIDVLAYRILPCTIYDTILSFIMFAVMIRIIAPPVTTNRSESFISDVNNSRW